MSERPADQTVLVVDDEKNLADLYADWLGEEYRVVTAYGGKAALETIEEGTVDIVLLDRHMPDLSGDLVLTALRDRGYDMPVAMVTGVEPELNVLRLGFDEYLLKPVDGEDLIDTVADLTEVESYDAHERKLSELRVKRNVLRVELPAATLERSDEFARLEQRIQELERTTEVYHQRVAAGPVPRVSEPEATPGD